LAADPEWEAVAEAEVVEEGGAAVLIRVQPTAGIA
jgi:hypothetical protein